MIPAGCKAPRCWLAAVQHSTARMSLRRLSRATATSSLKHSAPQLAAHLVRHALRNVLLHVCNVLALVVRVAVPAPFRGQGANSTTIVGSLRNDNWQELCARQDIARGSRSGSWEVWDPCCQDAATKLAKVRLGCNSSRRGCRLRAPGAMRAQAASCDCSVLAQRQQQMCSPVQLAHGAQAQPGEEEAHAGGACGARDATIASVSWAQKSSCGQGAACNAGKPHAVTAATAGGCPALPLPAASAASSSCAAMTRRLNSDLGWEDSGVAHLEADRRWHLHRPG